MPQETAHYQSPVGALEIIATQCGIARVDFLEAAPVAKRAPASALMRECFAQLDGYFGGTRREFCLPLHEQTGTAFQRQVWAALRAIPFGQTRSYAQIAAEVGRPAAVRAVGNANGRNPLSIITPCHRVVPAAGKLGGYAGGQWRKQQLLGAEGIVLKI